MYRLSIENFQSIAKQTLEFSGFVAITGPSNLGKSSIRRALGSVLYNDWQPDFQRHYTRKKVPSTKLSFEKEGFFKISQNKPDNSFTLDQEGKESIYFAKVGRAVPEEVTSLGFNILEVNESLLNMNITRQTDQLFMVSYMTATNTAILNKLFHLTQLETASSLASKDQKGHVKDMNRFDKEHQESERQIHLTKEKLTEITTLRDTLESLLEEVDLIDSFLTSSQSAAETKESLGETQITILRLSKIESQLKSLSSLSEFNGLRVALSGANLGLSQVTSDLDANVAGHMLLTKSLSIGNWLRLTEDLKGSRRSLSEFDLRMDPLLSSQASLMSLSTLTTYLDGITNLSSISSRASLIGKSLEDLYEVRSLKILLNYTLNKSKVLKAGSLTSALEVRIEGLRALVPELEGLGLLASYFSLNQDCVDLGLLLVENERSMEKSREELESFPRCETCGQVAITGHEELV